jgi:hypothetical protein
MANEDWFHSILEHLYSQPLNGQWHDLRELMGEDKPIYFNFDNDWGSYERLNDVLDFLVARNFIRWKLEYEKGYAPNPNMPSFGEYLDLGKAPRMVQATNGTWAELDRPATKESRKILAQLLPDGHSYWEKRIRDNELHQSILTGNKSIIATAVIALLALLVAIGNIVVSHCDAVKAREQSSLPNMQINKSLLPLPYDSTKTYIKTQK